jgi:tRNA(Ile)-lysidine synthetase-like protein
MGNQQTSQVDDKKRISAIWLRNQELWFNSTSKTDEKVKMLFESVKNFNFEPIAENARDSIDKIIFCDQIARHIYRNDKKQNDYYHGLAVIESKKGLVRNYDLDLNAIEKCFYLLPLRHTSDPDEILFCINKAFNYLETDTNQIYLNFIKASLKSFRKFYDKWHRIDQVQWEELIPILETSFEPTQFNMDDPFVKKVKKNLIKLPEKIIVSVSGGVDSMVLLYVLKNILSKKEINVANINYNNRNNSHLESKLAFKWAEYLKVPFRCRKIIEIQRSRDKHTLRNFYENYTRAIRFDLYKSFGEEYQSSEYQTSDSDDDWDIISSKEKEKEKATGVFLGHNQDDSIENIFRNISQEKNYSNLFGMTYLKEERGVLIYRPFLNITKREILAYAKAQGIPYTKDSTPSRSRGRIRDELVPFLNNFDPNLIPGLMQMSEHLNDLSKLCYQEYYQKLINKISYSENKAEGIIPKDNTVTSWKIILKTISNYYKLPFLSNKSINNLIERVNTLINSGESGKVNISKRYFIEIDGFKKVFVWHKLTYNFISY